MESSTAQWRKNFSYDRVNSHIAFTFSGCPLGFGRQQRVNSYYRKSMETSEMIPIYANTQMQFDDLEADLASAAMSLLADLCPEIMEIDQRRQQATRTVIERNIPAAIRKICAEMQIAECLGPAAFQYAVLSLARDGLQFWLRSRRTSNSRRAASPGSTLPAP